MKREIKPGQYLGPLCRARHEYADGKTLRSKYGVCLECNRLYNLQKYHKDPKAYVRGLDRDRARINGTLRKRRAWLKDPEKQKAYTRQYRKAHPIRMRLRARVFWAILRLMRDGVVVKERKPTGIDIKAIVDHLGPCPGSRREWHIDHVRPLCTFDLANPEHVRLAFAPENHQWLPAKENMMKHAKWEGEHAP
jgi:hypothetical protein